MWGVWMFVINIRYVCGVLFLLWFLLWFLEVVKFFVICDVICGYVFVFGSIVLDCVLSWDFYVGNYRRLGFVGSCFVFVEFREKEFFWFWCGCIVLFFRIIEV